MGKICSKFVPRVLREDKKELGDGRADQFRSRSSRCSGDLRGKLDLLLQGSQWKHAVSPKPKKAKQSKSTHKHLMIPFVDSTGTIYIHWVPTGQTANKEYYVEVLREFRKRFRWEGQYSSNRFSGISTRTTHQSTTPSLSQTI